MPVGIERGQHASGLAMQIAVEATLQAAEPVVIGADVTQHLRGQRIIRIETA